MDPCRGGELCVVGNSKRKDTRVLGADTDAVHLHSPPRRDRARDLVSTAKRPSAIPSGLRLAQ